MLVTESDHPDVANLHHLRWFCQRLRQVQIRVQVDHLLSSFLCDLIHSKQYYLKFLRVEIVEHEGLFKSSSQSCR